MGKIVLLGEFARLADEAQVPAVQLDGRDLEPSPPGFLAALGRALEEPPDGSPLEALARRPRMVLLVDTYEVLARSTPGCASSCCPSCPAGTWSCSPGATHGDGLPGPGQQRGRWTFESTDGPVEHVKTACERGHWFTPMVASLNIGHDGDELAVGRLRGRQ